MDKDDIAGCSSNSVRKSKRTKTLSYKAELNAKITARAAYLPVSNNHTHSIIINKYSYD